MARRKGLEIGFGSGRNLPFYGDGVDEVVGIDALPEMLALAQQAAAAAQVKTTRLA